MGNAAASKRYYDANRDRILAERRERRANDPEHREKLNRQKRESDRSDPRRRKGWELKSCYGITLDDYDTMLEDQGGGCAICEATTDDPKHHRSFLDVDHTGGRGKEATVRGLLCSPCNLGIGKFYDDPDLLRKAAAYLEGQ